MVQRFEPTAKPFQAALQTLLHRSGEKEVAKRVEAEQGLPKRTSRVVASEIVQEASAGEVRQLGAGRIKRIGGKVGAVAAGVGLAVTAGNAINTNFDNDVTVRHYGGNTGSDQHEMNVPESLPTDPSSMSVDVSGTPTEVEAGIRVDFQEGETPDSEAQLIAGIEPGNIDEASPSQREVYTRTREVITGELGNRGIDAHNIPEGTKLHLPQDPNIQ